MRTIFYNLLFTSIVFFFTTEIIAQPPPCGVNPIMANNCADACVICDIDGYTGTNDLQAGGQDLGNVFCSNANDMHYIAFIAGSTSLSIQIDVSNCSSGSMNFQSLDLGFFESSDCQNFTPITPCKMDLENGDSFVFDTDTPLTVGQYYYLIMDGSAGSICDWTFSVLEGTTAVSPLDESGEIIGDAVVCPELIHEYQVDFPIGATDFDWTIDGVDLNVNDSIIDYQFPTDGVYELCVTSKNVCDQGLPSCREITVQSVPVTEIMDVFCEGGTYVIAGDTIVATGIYEYTLQNVDGCDSIIIAEIELLETPVLSIDIDICEGDTLFAGNNFYTETGIYQETLTSNQECDSIINVDLFVIVCTIQSNVEAMDVGCFGTATGAINFEVENGTAPFTYSWQDLNNTQIGNGTIIAVGEQIEINNIPIGTYVITIEDSFGNSDILISEVNEPEPMTAEFLVSNYNGVSISCNEGMDGTITVNVTGGVAPYTYLWSSGETTTTIEDLAAGEYQLTILDAVGCELIVSTTLSEPTLLSFTSSFVNAGCEGLNTGMITIDQTEGGIAPYMYSLNGGPVGSITTFEDLSPMNYTVTVFDENGCSQELSDNITAPEIPIVDLGEDFVIELGETINWNPTINPIFIQSINWTSLENLSCTDCLDPEVLPLFSNAYVLEIVSEDGCLGIDSVNVSVLKIRKAYFPNVFSPNSDGVNDYFTLFGDLPNVQLIEELSIYDRWGGLLVDKQNILPNEPSMGWDGTVEGAQLDAGIYVYTAKVRFLDNEVILYSGDVALLR